MITFECPDRKATVSASESQAGKAMSCPKCFFMLVVPGPVLVSPVDTSPPTAPGSPAAGQQASTAARPFRIRRILVVPIVVVCLIATGFLCLIGLQRVREAAARAQSKNNLRNIALGFHQFHDAHKRLPFNGGARNQPGQQHSARARPGAINSGSWGFQILPYVGQSSL